MHGGNMKSNIIYEDKDVIVAYKPGGLATQTARIGQADMVSELKNYLAGAGGGANPYLGVVHRLDQPVEGLLIFGKTKEAAAGLTGQLSRGVLKKAYYAVVCGQPPAPEGELVDFLVKEDSRARIAGEGQRGAQRAVLQYHILQSVRPSRLSGESDPLIHLAWIRIGTGRFHQIRAQMSHAGMPLLGDNKYADARTAEISRLLGIRQVALCAFALECLHPVTGQRLSFIQNPRGEVFSYFTFS